MNEIASIQLGMDEAGGGIREDVNKVTEEAIRRVQEDQKKAQQIGQQIKQDKDINNKLAKFVGTLLKNIKDDELIANIYQVFFKTTDTKTNLTNLRKDVNTIFLTGIFVPFFVQEAEENGICILFSNLNYNNASISLTEYVKYIKELENQKKDEKNNQRDSFIILITKVVSHFGLVPKLSPEQNIELKNTISKEIYG